MSAVGRTSLLGVTGFAAALVGGGVLSAGTAEAAPVPEVATLERRLPLDDFDGDGDDVGNAVRNNKARVTGGHNAVSASSPTKNLGNQHNSGSNVARQISFQYALCKQTKNCRITQKFTLHPRFVGFSGPILEREPFKFSWPITLATAMVRPSSTSLSVKSPGSGMLASITSRRGPAAPRAGTARRQGVSVSRAGAPPEKTWRLSDQNAVTGRRSGRPPGRIRGSEIRRNVSRNSK